MDRAVLHVQSQLGRHLLGAAEPIVRVLGEGLEHDRIQVRRDAALDLPRRHRRLILNPADELELVVAPERQRSSHQGADRAWSYRSHP